MTRLLTDTDRNRAWRQARIQTFESAEPSTAPVLLSIGAQPGAGKTRAVVRTMNTFYPARSFVPIIGDNLRRYHPDYPALVSSPDPDLIRLSIRWYRRSSGPENPSTKYSFPKKDLDLLDITIITIDLQRLTLGILTSMP